MLVKPIALTAVKIKQKLAICKKLSDCKIQDCSELLHLVYF